MESDSKITPPTISDEERKLIKSQLKNVLAHKNFSSAKQMQRFLTYIVEKTMAGEEKLLKQYTIAVEALSMAEDFDPDSNPAVRIIGSRVRERLKEYYQQDGKYDEVIIAIAKGSYVPKFKKNIPTVNTADENAEKSQGPKLALVCFSDRTQANQSNKLLFQVTDDLAKELSRFLFARLVVCNPYADKDQSYSIEKQIRENDHTDYILALYLQELPNSKYELLYRLLDVYEEEVLWSESYPIKIKQSTNELNSILRNITASVADIHQGILFIHWSRKLLEDKNNIPEKYQTLAYFRHFSDDLGVETFKTAVDACSRALERNPNDIIANIIFAEYCRRDYVYGYNVIESPLQEGQKAAELATRLKLNSHEAHYALGQILFCLGEWERSVDSFNLARDISKFHNVIEYGCGFHFCLMSHWTEGMQLIKNAMSSITSYPSWFHLGPFLSFYNQGDYKKALSEAKKITTPSILHGPLARAIAYAQLGIHNKAQEELEEVLIRYPAFIESGKKLLLRFLGTEELTEKVWDGILKIQKHQE